MSDFTVLSTGPSHGATHDSSHARKRKREKLERQARARSTYRQQQRNKCIDRTKTHGICESRVVDSSSVGTVDNTQGVQMMSREITSVAERPDYTGDHEMSDATIKESAWDLSRMVERPTLVTAFKWNNASSSVVYTGQIPADMLPVTLTKIPFQAFQYWRGDTILRLQVAGSPMVQGILAMTFVPLTTQQEISSITWDRSSLTINPTVYLYANTNTHAELRIPYNHIQAYLDTNFNAIPYLSQTLGTVVIWVVEPFAGITLTEVTVSLFSALENSEFKVPRLSSSIGRAEANVLTNLLGGLGHIGSSLIEPMMGELGSVVKGVVSSVIPSPIVDVISDVASKALPSNFIGDAIDFVGGTLSSTMGLLGLDNPTIPVETHRVIVKSNGAMNYAVGPEYIEKMAVIPSAMAIVTPESFATVTDEMDVSYLYRRYSYFGHFDIHATDPTGRVVASFPISPFPTLINNNTTGKSLVPIGSLVQNRVWFPLLSYLGLPYRYWTGGLKYKFIVSASSLHTCRVFVSFNYGRYGSSPLTLLDMTSQYGIALEISQGSNEFEFSVPYVALQPYSEVCNGELTEENSLGTIWVTVVNPLVAPPTVSQSISIAMFVAGSDDFSYEFLGEINPAIAVYQSMPPSVREAANDARDRVSVVVQPTIRDGHLFDEYPDVIGIAESNLVDSQTVAPTNITTTTTDMAGAVFDDDDQQVAPPQAETTVDDHFGVVSISLRNLLKKYQMIRRYGLVRPIPTTTVVPSVSTVIPLSELLSIPNMVQPAPYAGSNIPSTMAKGLITWAGAMYRQFKGSLRCKIVLSQPARQFSSATVYFMPGTEIDASLALSTVEENLIPKYDGFTLFGDYYMASKPSSRLSVLTSISSNVLEFEIPYASPYLTTLTYSGGDVANDPYRTLGSLILVVDGLVEDKITATVYIAFGDETRFGTLYRVPLVYAPAVFKTTSMTLTPYTNVELGGYAVGTAESALVDRIASMTITPSAKMGGVASNSQSKSRPGQRLTPMQYYRFRLRRFASKYRSLSHDEVADYIRKLTRGNIFPSSPSFGKLLQSAGIHVGKDGRYQLSTNSRFRRRAKPVGGKNPPSKGFDWAASWADTNV